MPARLTPDNTLNGAQEHIFRFFEALALYRYGTVPWRSVKFMLDSTETLVQAVETRRVIAASANAMPRSRSPHCRPPLRRT